MAVSSDVCWCRHVKQAHWGSGNCKHAYCGCEEYEPKDATRAASQERPRPDPEPCALWGVCVRPRGHDGPHTSTVEDAARLAAQERPTPCSTCGARVTLTTCHECHWKIVRASQERPPIDVERLAEAMEIFSFPPASWPPDTSFVEAIAAEYLRLSGSVGEP